MKNDMKIGIVMIILILAFVLIWSYSEKQKEKELLIEIIDNETTKYTVSVKGLEQYAYIDEQNFDFYSIAKICGYNVPIGTMTSPLKMFFANEYNFDSFDEGGTTIGISETRVCIETNVEYTEVCMDNKCINVTFNEEDCNNAIEANMLSLDYTKISCFEKEAYS